MPPDRASDDHVLANRVAWNRMAADYAAKGRENWAAAEPTWGIWDVPEADVGMLPLEAAGMRTVELGCGTAYVSAWLARRGAWPVGIDNSPAQLATARTLQQEFELAFPLIHADAERVPLAGGSFDFAISEYGAAIWCDPYRWIPEAARLLRPGGRLVWLGNSTLLMICAPDLEEEPVTDRMLRPYFGMHRFAFPDTDAIEFHLPHSETISLLGDCGLEVEELVEPRPADGSTTRHTYVSLDWAQRWPCEEIWKAVKRR